MKAKQVLVVEDNRDIAQVVALNLGEMGCHCDCVSNGREGLEKALGRKYDLIILDVGLPELDGLEICKRIRLEKVETIVLMLTAKSDEVDKVLGLELGADDYLTKPFGVRELVARVKALFRRSERHGRGPEPSKDKEQLRFGHLLIDLEKHTVTRRGKAVDLTAKEFELLKLFASHPGRCYSRQQLLATVWGYEYEGYDHTINTHINRLRGKIEENPNKPKYIQTLRGVGYKIAEPEEFE